MPTMQPSFLARKTLGQPNYLLIALAAVFVVALAPRGAFKAIRSNSNNLDAWLPAAHEEIADLNWFREQFDGDQFVLVSWDGCTLAEAGKLQRVARKLAPEAAAVLPVAQAAEGPLFTRVATGPDIIDQLTAPPYNLPYEVAIERLEGAMVGPAADGVRGGDQAARTTCLVAYLSPWASENEAVRREAIDRIREVAAAEAHIDASAIRMVGPGIDAIAIDDESYRTLAWLGSAAVVAGFAIAAWRLRSFRMAALVTAVALASAMASLAIVFYFGIFEVLSLGRVAPQLGKADALVLGIPVVVYILSMVAALRLTYYYRDARLNGHAGPAGQAVADGWPMWGISALLIAAALGALCISELSPARKFGLFTGLGVIAGVGMVVAIVPVFLHRFPPAERALASLRAGSKSSLPRWLNGLFEFSVASPVAVLIVGLLALGAATWGVTKLDASPRLPALASGNSDLMQDYAWFEEHVGNAVPMEVVLTVPTERCREPNEPAEADGQQYRLTLEERMRLMRDLEAGMAKAPQISAVLSAGTATPAAETLAGSGPAVREAFQRHGYVRVERHKGSDQPTGRELWRLSARVAASTAAHDAVDYADVVYGVRNAVTPVLLAYEQRDWLVRRLHAAGKELSGAKVAVLFREVEDAQMPAEGSQEALLADLLRRSGVANGEVRLVNLTAFETTGRAAEAARDQTTRALLELDAVALAAIDRNDATVEQLVARGVKVADVTQLPGVEESTAAPLAEAGGPRPIRAVFTGMPPVANAANAELMATLRTCAMVVIPGLALVMMFVAWNAVGGLLSTLPILLPAAVMLGALGWMGVDIDMGLLLAVGLAIGVALEATIHYVAWVRRGGDAGLFPREAARMAYGRVAPATLDVTLIAGVGMVAFAASGIASAQLMGVLTMVVMGSALVGTVVLLPALVASPLGHFFGAEKAPQESALGLASVRVDAPRAVDSELKGGRADVAAAAGPAPPHRAKPGVTAEDRQEMSEGPHSALHAKLQRLRRPTGDSPSS